MLAELSTNWKPILESILSEYPDLDSKLEQERESSEGLAEIYPPPQKIFEAFNYFPTSELKIVIIGQDPYHQPNQAHGLAFSVNDSIKIPPSLQNIFKEIDNSFEREYQSRDSGNLTFWAKQGILLLNTTLTVRQSKPNSHVKIWKGFTQKIIDYILEEQENIIFMLWGNNAKSLVSGKGKILEKHHIYQSVHPSPLSANRGGWFHQKMFAKVNQKLLELGKVEIKWY
jgi:uracil-DNA glycosylase